MRQILPLFLFLFTAPCLMGQNQQGTVDGTISYITSQNVYVKFISTANIRAGDTLYVQKGDVLIPALKVTDLSSISCVCIPLSDIPFKVSDKILAKPAHQNKIPPETLSPSTNVSPALNSIWFRNRIKPVSRMANNKTVRRRSCLWCFLIRNVFHIRTSWFFRYKSCICYPGIISDYFFSHSSVRTPKVDLGWRKAISRYSAPCLGCLSISCIPLLLSSMREASILLTANAIWWIPSPFFSINLPL